MCIATYKRPAKLIRLISSILDQEINEKVNVKIIIVDNDRNESAREIVCALIQQGVNIVYDVEPEQNIALARNRALLHAQGEYVAFIDDDEQACNVWLANLLKVALQNSADVVFGPVLPVMPDNSPKWVINGGFFDRPRMKTGSTVQHGRTGNALVKRSKLIESRDQPFLKELGLIGGSDFELFERVRDSGGKLVWSDEAIVTEEVEEDRPNLKWLALRSFRGGLIFAERSGARPSGLGLISWVSLRGMVILGGVLAAIICWPFSRALAAKSFFKSCSYFGQVMSLTEYRYLEYARK